MYFSLSLSLSRFSRVSRDTPSFFHVLITSRESSFSVVGHTLTLYNRRSEMIDHCNVYEELRMVTFLTLYTLLEKGGEV